MNCKSWDDDGIQLGLLPRVGLGLLAAYTWHFVPLFGGPGIIMLMVHPTLVQGILLKDVERFGKIEFAIFRKSLTDFSRFCKNLCF